MESGSFQSQVLCVMEVLAKAALAEINRRVDDSCAVLRLEVSQSRRDIDLLRRKCEVMEAELRRSRMRARRRAERPSAPGRTVPNKGRQRTDLDRRVEAEAQSQPQRRADVDPTDEAEHRQIKEERSEDDMWQNEPEEKLNSGPEELLHFQTDNTVDRYRSADNPTSGPMASQADGYDTFPEQQLNRTQNETDLVVKLEKEEEPDENAAPLHSGHRLMTPEGDGQTWFGRDPADPNVFCSGQDFGQISTVFSSQSSVNLQDMVPRIHSVGRSVVVSAARIKRRIRWFGPKRPEPDEGHSALSQVNSMDPSSQHQIRDSFQQPHDPDGDLTAQVRVPSVLRGHGRAGAGPARTPWAPRIGEKRFSCTYCDKSFMRFSQLKEHQRSHTGEKPFSCPLCGRSFTKQCNLIRHAVVHSGEKPYECSLCGKCFTQRSSLKSHQKTAH